MSHAILFVCTGNIFRSMVAEYAVRAQIGSPSRYRIESAGIEAKPQTIHPVIRSRLLQKGADPSHHIQQSLTKELIDRTDLVIAMSQNHQTFIRERFGVTAPLFNEISFDTATSILDLHEAIPNWERDLLRARDYVESVIDQIWDAVPALLARLPRYL